jgi:hypothetical protein
MEEETLKEDLMKHVFGGGALALAACGSMVPAAFGQGGELVYTPVTPCRIVDTRQGGGPIAGGTQRNFVVTGNTGFVAQGGNAAGCGLPTGLATSVMFNFTAVNMTGAGNARAWAVASPQPAPPNASILNFGQVAGLGAIANGIAVPICDPAATSCAAGELRVQIDGASANMVIDVVGFFQKIENFQIGKVADFSAFRFGSTNARHHLISNRDMVFNGFDLGGGAGDAVFIWRSNPTVFDENNWVDLMSLHDNGNLAVVGTLSKGGGSFKIDHPLDPLNRFLQHSFVESPDMKNIYDGMVTTNAEGLAIVELPEWFEALNRDFRYQLTVVGEFAQAVVARKMADNRFTIRTDKPNVEVSWLVTGIRKDAFAEKHRIPVESAKPAAQRGSYLHPEAWPIAPAARPQASADGKP